MKFLNTKYLIVLAFSIVLLGSCEQAEMVSPNIEKTKRSADAESAPLVVVSNTAYGSISGPFAIPNFTIEDEIIMLTTNFNGISESADFYLTTDGSVDLIDGEPVINLKLIRNMNNISNSKGSNQQQLRFNLSPLKAYSPKSVYLNIDGVGMVNHTF
jgi:hypothetical protein